MAGLSEEPRLPRVYINEHLGHHERQISPASLNPSQGTHADHFRAEPLTRSLAYQGTSNANHRTVVHSVFSGEVHR
jgi:hypothetical protein